MGKRAGKELLDVALGRARADIAIVNAKLANVYTGELLENNAVTIKGKWIAYVGEKPEDNIGESTVVIDAKGSGRDGNAGSHEIKEPLQAEGT